jgi:hypothetical protein
MPNMKNQFTLLLATALLTVTLSAAGQSYELKNKYRKGQTYHYNLTSVTNTTMEMGGQERVIKSTTDQLFAVKIENVKKGKTTMLSTFEKVKVSLNFQGKDTVMEVPDMVGLRTRLTLLPNGKTIDVIKLDTLKNDVMQGMMQQNTLSLHFLKLPGKKVKAGDTWDYSGTDSTYDAAKKLVETTVNIKLNFEKEEIKNGHNCLRIAYTNKITTKGTSTMQGMEMYRDGSGDSKGTVWFDPKSGILVADESETNMDITVALTGEMAMTIPITVIEKQTYMLQE